MPMRVTSSPVQYSTLSTPNGVQTNTKAISPGTAFERLPSDIQILYQMYPAIPYVSAFLSACSTNIKRLTYSGLLLGARLCVSIKKLLSGIEFEIASSATVEQQLFIAKLHVLVGLMENDFLTESMASHTSSMSASSVNLEISHEFEETLQYIENWKILDNLVATNTYTPIGASLSGYLGQICISAKFIRK